MPASRINLFRTTRPQCAVTVVLAVEELLPGFESPLSAETVAVFFITVG